MRIKRTKDGKICAWIASCEDPDTVSLKKQFVDLGCRMCSVCKIKPKKCLIEVVTCDH